MRRWQRDLGLAFAIGASLAASACATTTYSNQPGDRRVRGAFEQPFRDVSWMREDPPEVLIRAEAAPYELDEAIGCEAIVAEIAALDSVLGPDLDADDQESEQSSTDVTGVISGAIRGVVGLPYRGIFRRLSGAEHRERVLREAIFAGIVRRAFLKGVAREGCAPGAAP